MQRFLEKIYKIPGAQPLRRFFSAVYRHDLPGLAAELTFYFIAAFFPFLILLFTLISFTPLTAESTLLVMLSALPKDVYEILVQMLTGIKRSLSIIITSSAIALWSMSRVIKTVGKALNRFYRVQENRNPIFLRFLGILAAFAIAIAVILSFVLLILGSTIDGLLQQYLPQFQIVWDMLRWLFIPLFLAVAFAFLYKVMPNRAIPLRDTIIGALFTAFIWGASSVLFSVYVDNFSRYHIIYGGLGGIIALVTWLYMSSNIILLGGLINAWLEKKKSK